jgi:hypothetical protein
MAALGEQMTRTQSESKHADGQPDPGLKILENHVRWDLEQDIWDKEDD